jgi:hypothetical protein
MEVLHIEGHNLAHAEGMFNPIDAPVVLIAS